MHALFLSTRVDGDCSWVHDHYDPGYQLVFFQQSSSDDRDNVQGFSLISETTTSSLLEVKAALKRERGERGERERREGGEREGRRGRKEGGEREEKGEKGREREEGREERRRREKGEEVS